MFCLDIHPRSQKFEAHKVETFFIWYVSRNNKIIKSISKKSVIALWDNTMKIDECHRALIFWAWKLIRTEASGLGNGKALIVPVRDIIVFIKLDELKPILECMMCFLALAFQIKPRTINI